MQGQIGTFSTVQGWGTIGCGKCGIPNPRSSREHM